MRKLLVAVTVLLLLSGQLLAQRTITGTVTDQGGLPIPNVSIIAKQSSTGTTSKEDGTYLLTVPADVKVLVFSSVGKETKEVAIGTSNTINVSLLAEAASMDEVVVVAYGSIKRENFLGSAAQVNADQIKNRALTNPLNALVGAAPGIQTTMASGAPGSSPGIIMRGIGSFSLGNGPLYIVDGAVYEAGFSNINPDDIETITALKDAATTALYGSRASNGVIMITTKKGRKGRQTLQFKVQMGTSDQAIGPYSTISTDQYYPLAWEAYRNGLVFGPTATTMDSASRYASGLMPRHASGPFAGQQIFRGSVSSPGSLRDIYQMLGNYNPYNVGNTDIVGIDGKLNPNARLLYPEDLDWLDQASRKGSRKEYSLSYTAGSDKADMAASFGYLKEEGWGLRSSMERFSGRVNVNVQPTTWFRTGINLAANRSTFNNSATGGIVNPFYFARYIAPIYPVYLHEPGTGEYVVDATGNRRFDFGNDEGYGRPFNSGRHSIAEHLWNRDNSIRDVLSARAYGEIVFTPWLKLTNTIAADFRNEEDESYENPIVGDGYPSGRFSKGTAKVYNYTFNQILNFNKRFGVHNIDAILGHETYGRKSLGTSGMRIGQNFDDVYVYGNFGTINSLTSSIVEETLESYLSRFNYEYDNRYLFSASIRRDGSSKFRDAIRWHNFWSAAAGWKIDREAFFRVSWVDLLKLRVSYGEMGNSSVNDYLYQGGYAIGVDDNTRAGTYLNNLGSPELTWESGNTLDVGVDFSLFKQRLSGSLGYFNRATSGLLFSVPLPLQAGGTTTSGFNVWQNIGNMTNKGIEVQLIGNVIRNKDFNWSVTLNATHFKNEITKMPALIPSIQSGVVRREEGRSYYDFYVRNFYGIDPTDGSVLYLGVTNPNAASVRLMDNGKGGFDTVTTDHSNAVQNFVDKTSLPDVYGSLINSFSYKGFELNVTLTYQIGGYVYDGVYATLMSPGINGTTYHTDILNRWQTPGQTSSVPRMDNLRTAEFGAASTRWLTSATYLAINNISLSYNLPTSFLSRFGSSNARVYLSAENLRFFTKRKGMNVNGSFAGTTGDTFDAARIINAGISVNF